jgi:hypothetical protein
MKTPTHRRRQAHLALAAVVSAVSAVSAVLYRFPPETHAFYPRCPFHALTGLLCPGCGATRALGALVHGHLGDALRWNALVVILLPIFAAYGAMAYRRAVTEEEAAWPGIPNAAITALLIVTLVFAIARNIA